VYLKRQKLQNRAANPGLDSVSFYNSEICNDAFVMLCGVKVYFFAYRDLHFLTAAFLRYTYILTDGITTRARNKTGPVYILRFCSKLKIPDITWQLS